jgi:hypothetical protein
VFPSAADLDWGLLYLALRTGERSERFSKEVRDGLDAK